MSDGNDSCSPAEGDPSPDERHTTSDEDRPSSTSSSSLNSQDYMRPRLSDSFSRHSSSSYSTATEDPHEELDAMATSTESEGEFGRVRLTPRTRRRDDDDKFDPTPRCDRPKHKWNALLEVDRRLCLGRGRLFKRRCYGSLRSAERLELMAKLDGHDGCVNSVSFNQEGDLLASGSDDLTCMVWEWQANRLMVVFNTGHRSNVFQTKFMPNRNNRCLVTAARDGAVRIHELTECGSSVSSSRKVAYHRGSVHKLSIHPAIQETIMSSGEDGVVYEIDLRMPNPSALMTVRNDRDGVINLYSIAINPCKPYEFCVAGSDRFVRCYDRRMAKPQDTARKLCPSHLVNSRNVLLSVSCAVYNFDGSEVMATYSDEDIYIFNNTPPHPPDQDFLYKFQGHRNSQTVKSVNYFGLRSEYVVSGSDCGHIFLWDKKTSHIVNCLYGDEGGVVNALEPNPCAPYLATSGFDHNVKIWAPSADEPPNLSEVRAHTINNMRERENDMDDDPPLSHMDRSQMLLYLMDVLPSRAMRSFHFERDHDSDTSSDDEDMPNPSRGQCPTS